MNLSTKTCTKCQQVKPIDEFYLDRSRKDGLTCWCRLCNKDIHEARREQRKEYMRNRYRDNREQYLEYFRAKYVPRFTRSNSLTRDEAKLAGFRSGFERTLNYQLLSSGVKYSYETLKLPYILEGTYNPDFILENGIIIEAKGYLDAEAKRKMIAVKAQHPDLDIRFVFQNAQSKVSKSKQTHAQWADRNGFPWADREIPQEWLNDHAAT